MHKQIAPIILASALAIATLGTGNVSAQYASRDTACTRQYTVVKGDTCDKIGQQTLTSTYQIMALNLPESGPDCHTLQIGAELCLGRYGNDCQLVHRARSSDTCESIAGQYGISVTTLRQNNPNVDCGQVYSGLMLCTVDGLIRPTADSALPLSYTAPVAGDMPEGTVLIAKATSNTSTTSDKKLSSRHLRHGAHPQSH